MRRADSAAADIKRGARKFVDAQQLETHRCSDDIHDCVHGAYFVKVDFLDRRLVHLCFGFAQPSENTRGAIGGSRRKLRFLNHSENLRKTSMRVMLLRVDPDLSGIERAALHLFRGNLPTLNRETTQLGFDLAKVGTRVYESAEDHVAADSRKAIEVRDLHFLRDSLFGAQRCAES